MNVTLVEELDDGGAIMQFEMSQEELIALAKIGIIQGLKEMIAREPREFVKELRNEGFYRKLDKE